MITTPRRSSGRWDAEARHVAVTVGGIYVPRDGRPLHALEQFGWPVAVVGEHGLRVHTDEGELYYHPGMGRPRIIRLQGGGADPMVQAMDLRPGDTVLDCTLGLGTDAIVASYVVGATGRVVGWESVALLAEMVRRGLQEYDDENAAFLSALRRVEVAHRDHRYALPELPARSFDVVYFDPMFREPIYASTHLAPLRKLSDERSLTQESVQEAMRVARRRVVVKERVHSSLFRELGITETLGGRQSRVTYGLITIE